MTVAFHLPTPPLLNTLYKIGNKKFYKSDAAKQYKWECFLQAKAQKIKILEGELEVTILWFRKANKGDIDGILKCLLDALEGSLYKNDSQIQKLTVIKSVDKENPRVEVFAKPFHLT